MKHYAIIILLSLMTYHAHCEDGRREPEKLIMTLAKIEDSNIKNDYVFVIHGLFAFKTIDGLKKMIAGLPPGSTITFDPGCDRIGDEPLLRSTKEMNEFKKFCESVNIKFILVPAG